MAEVVIKEEVTETVTHTVDRIKALKCDVCGKEFTGKYWDLTTQHSDWGNDSCESIKSFDLCSKECVQKKLDEYFKKCEHSDTQEFHLEQDYFKEYKRG